MILGVSRFRVRNGMEREVADAFHERPRLVDRVPGFLGMETFTDRDDATIFYLVTRWTDEASFRRWHSSPAHKQSHVGIPKGLKLNAAFTRVIVLERLHDAARPVQWEEFAADLRPSSPDSWPVRARPTGSSRTGRARSRRAMGRRQAD